MLYRFLERNDTGIANAATASTKKEKILWRGKKVQAIRDLLANTEWRLLDGETFDEDNPEHWRILPELLSGSRLWVEVEISKAKRFLNSLFMTKQQVPDQTLRAASSRIPMWINTYRDVVNTAKLMAGANVKLIWVLGPTDHCSSCLKLAGKVKRKREWLSAGIQPQSRALECGGFNCQCSLQPTSERASPGRLPSLP